VDTTTRRHPTAGIVAIPIKAKMDISIKGIRITDMVDLVDIKSAHTSISDVI
jgi:hypothetical protein